MADLWQEKAKHELRNIGCDSGCIYPGFVGVFLVGLVGGYTTNHID